MKFGIIYNLIKSIVDFLYHLNIVEIIKWIVGYFTNNQNNRIRNIQISIDLFIIAKFFLVLLIWRLKIANDIVEIIIWYLIISNIFTYFYYHVWVPPFQVNNDSKRRRFINLVISFIFSNICFAILYSEFYFEFYELKLGHHKELSSLLMSSYNSILGNYEVMKPKNDYGYFVSLLQLGISFVFLSIVLSVSVPQLDKDKS